jgi:hypothetical protein
MGQLSDLTPFPRQFAVQVRQNERGLVRDFDVDYEAHEIRHGSMSAILPQYQMDAETAAERVRELEAALDENFEVTLDENSHQGWPVEIEAVAECASPKSTK